MVLVSGLVLGLVIILPIGAQSLFVINQGMLAGFPRVFVGIVTVCCCDSLLIIFGAGASALLAALGYQEVLIVLGTVFLIILGILTLRAHPQTSDGEHLTRVGAIMAQAVGVSVLNPHAILDTIGILGAAIAVQAAHERLTFAAGVVGASWVWYLVLGMGAVILQRRITPFISLCIQRVSGTLMLIFAGVLALELA
jgi:L-lysine exporter family protein LysE/ArgO